MRNPDAERELDALLKVLDKAGADTFVDDATKSLSVPDCYDLEQRYRRIQNAGERRPAAESIERVPETAAGKRKA